MDYLDANTKHILADGGPLEGHSPLQPHLQDKPLPECADAKGKRVVVIGGGDTGVDCIGTALRQGCESVISFEILDKPPETRAGDNPWPTWPRIFRVDYGHSESMALKGRDPREYAVTSKRFISDGNGNVSGVETIRVDWELDEETGRHQMVELPGTEETFEADLVFLAMGFTGPESLLSDQFGLEMTAAQNYRTARGKIFKTNVDKLYVAGDCRRGQSLIVWAIDEGRQAAREIDLELMQITQLPVTGGVKKSFVPVTFSASLNSSKQLSGLDPAHNPQVHMGRPSLG